MFKKIMLLPLIITIPFSGMFFSTFTKSSNIEILDDSQFLNKTNNRDFSQIPKTTIDRRVVDVNCSTWIDPNGVINASSLEGYTHIEENAFYGADNFESFKIKEIILPNTITHIGGGAFSELRELEKIYIPKSVTDITYNPFAGNLNLKSIIFESDEIFKISNGILYDSRSKKALTIINYLFDLNSSNTINIQLLKDTKIIGKNFFSLTSGGYNKNPKFSLNPLLYSNVTIIEKSAFYNANLISFEINPSVTFIGDGAFTNFAGNIISRSNKFIITIFSDYDILSEKATDRAISLFNIVKNDVVADFHINYKIIGSNFLEQTQINKVKNLIIGYNVMEIRDEAFSSFTVSGQILFDANSKLEKIGILAFNDLGASLSGGPVTSLRVFLPEGLKYLGESAFYNTFTLKSLFIPKTVTYIGTSPATQVGDVSINLDPLNTSYHMDDGVLIENSTNSAIAYDYSWIQDPKNNGIFTIKDYVTEIRPRSFSALMFSNGKFKGIDIKNPNIIIGNGAFLNSGRLPIPGAPDKPGDEGTFINTHPDTPEHTNRYIVTTISTWDFGSVQDSSITNFGGGSYRGILNGDTNTQPLPPPDPTLPPGVIQTTDAILNKIPANIKDYLPSQFSMSNSDAIISWFTIIYPSREPQTTLSLESINTFNAKGEIQLKIRIDNRLVDSNFTSDYLIKSFTIKNLKKSITSSIYQNKISNDAEIPTNIIELNNYINWDVTPTDIINHDYSGPYQSSLPVKSKFSVIQILNAKNNNDKYTNNFNDNLLHVIVQIDNYYDKYSNWNQEGEKNYLPIYQRINLKGFKFEKIIPPPIIADETEPFIIYIIISILSIILLLLVLILFKLNFKKRK